MRLAIIADIHGNLHALEAVLRDITALGVDQIVVNGDMVNRGPNNAAVLERVMGQGYAVTLGNHDDLMRKWAEHNADIPEAWFDDPFWQGTAWAVEQLTQAGWLAALRTLPMTHKVALPGAPTLLISHGSPRHYREGYGTFLTDEQIAEIVQSHPADILIGSHTHRPLERHWGTHTILNTGAVGTPFNEDPRAQYLLLTLRGQRWAWEFRAVEYDQAAAIQAFEASGYLAKGNLSAFIFYQELRAAASLYAPYWMWAETQEKPMNWETWAEYCAELNLPFGAANGGAATRDPLG